MRFYIKQHQFCCGVDLHASAMYCCIFDATGEVVLHKNIPTKPKVFLRRIKPYRDKLPEPPGRVAKPSERDDLPKKFRDPIVRASIEVDLATIEHYEELLGTLERHLEKIAAGHDPVSLSLLKSIPGVGRILSLVMLYEIENISRFPRVQDFVSYCRLVKPAKESNG